MKKTPIEENKNTSGRAKNPLEMSKKTYKKAVAKQRQLKRFRKMKRKERAGDIALSDISEIEVKAKEEESQNNWLDDLVKTDKLEDSKSDPSLVAKSSSSQSQHPREEGGETQTKNARLATNVNDWWSTVHVLAIGIGTAIIVTLLIRKQWS